MPEQHDHTDRPSRRLLVGGLVAAILITAGFLFGPWHPSLVDLDVYRAGASALLHGDDIYMVTEPRHDLPFTYPVFGAIAFVPFTLLPLVFARLLLMALSLSALFFITHVTVVAVRRAIGVAGRSAFTWSVPLAVLAVAAHPVWDTLTFGQVNLILAAMILADVRPDGAGPGRWRGVLVGIATGVKLVPGLFIVYFLATGQRRAAITSAVTAAATVAVGFLTQPGPAWSYWTNYALDPARTGAVAGVTNQSILGVTARLLRDPQPPRALTFTLSAIVVVAALLLARRLSQAGDWLTAVTVVAVAALLASPISWSHHWVWMIPALGTVFAWAWHASSPATRRWRWTVFGVATAILVSGPMQFMPKTGLRELQHSLPQQLVANVYGLLAVLYLGWVAARVLPVRTRAAAPMA